MASRRIAVSAIRSATAGRPAAANCVIPAHRPCLPAGSRALLSTSAAPTRMHVAAEAFNKTRGLAAPAARWYSANAKPEEDSIPDGSKRWEFADITKQLETGQDANVVFVDVREPAELRDTGKIPGAINIPITTAVQSFHIPEEDFEAMYGFARPAKDKTLVFYCKAGVRAKTAAGLAKHAGWRSVGEYTGSWLDWAEKQGPVEKV